jgi:hypothetical protein
MVGMTNRPCTRHSAILTGTWCAGRWPNTNVCGGIAGGQNTGGGGWPAARQVSLRIGGCSIRRRLDSKSRMSREVHVRICERAGVQLPCATRLLIGFEREDDARRVRAVLEKRWERFGRTLHPDKTRLLPFWRPPQVQQSGKGPATFDFVGVTFYWRRTRQGHWRMWCKTRRASLRRAKTSIYDWCRRHRHVSSKAQHAALNRRLRGHCNHFGVSGN